MTCRHCNGAYVFGSTTDEGMTCPLRVGSHEPNSVLKVITLQNKASLGSTTLYADGQIFYYVDENIFEILNKTTSNLNITQKYRAQIGRDNIKFHYVHAADESTRIDPSVSNIVDTYLLTRSYDNSFRQYLW